MVLKNVIINETKEFLNKHLYFETIWKFQLNDDIHTTQTAGSAQKNAFFGFLGTYDDEFA